MKKRIFIWLLVLALAMSSLSGCSQAEEESDPTVETSSEKFETEEVEQNQEAAIEQLKEQSAAAAANSQESSREEKNETEGLRNDKDESEESTETVESSVPEESSAPAESSTPAESSVPAESSAPTESSAPVESSAPAESSAPVESSAPAESSAPVEEKPTEKLVTAGEITVGKTYIWDDYGAVAAFLELTNNTSETQRVRTTIRGYDTAGTVVEGDEGYISALGPGETSIMELFVGFFDTAPLDHVEYELYICETNNESGIKDIEIKETDHGRQIVYEATNKGPNTLTDVRAVTLFLDAEGKVLYSRAVSMHDIDWELKVGGTEAECMWVPLDEEGKVLSYSSRVTYFYAMRLKRSDQAAVGQPAEIQVVEEYVDYFNGGFIRVLVYKNVSTEPLKVRVTFTTHDPSDGAPVWVDHTICEVLEPGASMAVQDGLTIRAELGVAAQEVRFEVARTDDTSANSDLTVSAQPIEDGKFLALQVTNNSSRNIDSLVVLVIAYDSAGNFLHFDGWTFSDGEGALTAGGTSDEVHVAISTAREVADHWSLFIASAYYN